MINIFNRKPYRIRRDGHRVFVEWFRPIEQWSPKDGDSYLPTLREHVRASVDDATWTLVGREDPASNPSYRAYVEHVRTQLIEEYSLQEIADSIKIGVYHLGLLVLGFPSDNPEKYPYYCRGIQLKPYRKAEPSPAPYSSPAAGSESGEA